MTRLPENLVDVIAEVRGRWSLTIGDPFELGGQCSWVAPALVGSVDAVLKIGWPHEEAQHEADGLAIWDGDGAVRLLNSAWIDGTPALLLERCVPGTPLGAAPDPEERDRVVAGLLRRLWREPPPGHALRPLSQMCDQWAGAAEQRLRDGATTEAAMIRAGLEAFREMPRSTATSVVLFTDLHAANILRAEREPWLAIDPKPYVGDPTYDALQHMLNESRLAVDPLGLVARMADRLELDRGRLRSWLFARCAIEAIDEPEHLEVMRQIA